MNKSTCRGRCRRRESTFTGTERRIAPLHQNDFNTGDLRKRKYGISLLAIGTSASG
jgi:hypothetical protein